jgi:glucans biosynthesis protein C
MQHLSTRRYDLDWLRVIAFLLLIFYHIGMFYVP